MQFDFRKIPFHQLLLMLVQHAIYVFCNTVEHIRTSPGRTPEEKIAIHELGRKRRAIRRRRFGGL